MTPQEGYKLCKEIYPNREPIGCIDFGDCYVYSTIIFNGEDSVRLKNLAMDSSLRVDKESEKVSIYNPLIQKYDKSKAKEIKIFK